MKTLIILLTTLIVVACGTTNQEVLFKKHIFNKELHLLKIDKNTTAPTGVTLKISNKGTLEGFGGCNKYTGRYTIDKKYIFFKINDIDTKVCNNTYFEGEYIRKLVQSNKIILKNKKVYFYDRDNKILLVFTY